jgi:hypothetical protein
MDSLHVPRSVVQRLAAVVKWLLPYLLAGLFAGVGFGFRWLESRASRTDVAAAIAAVNAVAEEAKRNGYHGASLADSHARQLAALWSRLVAVEAELLVYREHGRADAARRGALVEQARKFYLREYEARLATHANDPSEAARLALLAEWRPQ